MVATQQKVNIVTEFFTKNSRGFNTVMNKNLSLFKDTQNSAGRLSKNFRGFNTVMGQSMARFKETTSASGGVNKGFKNMNNLGARLAHRTRTMTHGMKGFRMEMLGIMFFGMMFTRVLTGLLRTSLEWTGVMEIMSAALGILFLPVAELLLTWAISFLDLVSNLTEGQKKYIGALVLLGIGLSAVLMIVGQFALGIGSLIQVFGFLVGPLGLLLAALAGVTLLIFGPQIIDWFSSLTDGIDGAENKLATFGISADVLGALKNKLESFDFDKFLEIGTKILQGIVDGIHDNLDTLEEVIIKIGDALGEFVGKNMGLFIKIGLKIMGAIIVGMIQAALNLGFGIGNAITGALGIEHKTQAPDLFALHKAKLGGGVSPNLTTTGQISGQQSIPNMTVNIENNLNGIGMNEVDEKLRLMSIASAEDLRRMVQTR